MRFKSLNHFYYESPDSLRYYFDGRMQGHAGLGIIPVKFIEDYGPQQDGTTIRDWRVNPRTIELDVFLQGEDCCGTRGEQLAQLINIIRPNRGTTRDVPGWLRFFNDAAVLMEIPVHVLQGPSGNFKYNGDVGKHQVLDSIQFYAADPIWREFEQQSELATFSDIVSCLDACLVATSYEVEDEVVDPPVPLCLGSTSYALYLFDIPYTGTWDGDQIDITITGPISNPIIFNETLNATIEMSYIIPAGDSVTITIRPEFVTVIDNHGSNLIGTITNISDLVDFVIKCAGQITPDGVNDIIIFGIEPDVSITNFLLAYWTRHISAYGSPQCD